MTQIIRKKLAEKPWLIVTFRRTGGSTLTSLLTAMSNYQTIIDEAFNRQRMFGHITLEFLETRDLSTLDASVTNALMDTPNLKHCIDTVPFEVTSAVVAEANRRGYHIIVLTRRNEAHRLASLFLAQATETWSPRDAAKTYPNIMSGEITPQPIDLKLVKRRIKNDKKKNRLLRSMLDERQIEYQQIWFEDLYADESAIGHTVRDIAQNLNVDRSSKALSFPRGGDATNQRSQDIGPYVENYDAMLTLLNKHFAQKESEQAYVSCTR